MKIKRTGNDTTDMALPSCGIQPEEREIEKIISKSLITILKSAMSEKYKKQRDSKR